MLPAINSARQKCWFIIGSLSSGAQNSGKSDMYSCVMMSSKLHGFGLRVIYIMNKEIHCRRNTWKKVAVDVLGCILEPQKICRQCGKLTSWLQLHAAHTQLIAFHVRGGHSDIAMKMWTHYRRVLLHLLCASYHCFYRNWVHCSLERSLNLFDASNELKLK